MLCYVVLIYVVLITVENDGSNGEALTGLDVLQRHIVSWMNLIETDLFFSAQNVGTLFDHRPDHNFFFGSI